MKNSFFSLPSIILFMLRKINVSISDSNVYYTIQKIENRKIKRNFFDYNFSKIICAKAIFHYMAANKMFQFYEIIIIFGNHEKFFCFPFIPFFDLFSLFLFHWSEHFLRFEQKYNESLALGWLFILPIFMDTM